MSGYIATPPPLPEARVWRDGKLLVFYKDAELPMRCVKTNEPADRTLRRRLSWHEPVIYITLLGGILVYVILALVLRKTATVDVPLGPAARARRRRHIAIAWLIALGGAALCVVGIGADREEGVLVFVGGLGMMLAAAAYGLITVPPVKPRRIDDSKVYLKGACEAYLATLPERKI